MECLVNADLPGLQTKTTNTRANQQRVFCGRVVAGLSLRELPPVARWTSTTTGATVQTESHALKRVTDCAIELQGRVRPLQLSRFHKVAGDKRERPNKYARHDPDHWSGNYHHESGPMG